MSQINGMVLGGLLARGANQKLAQEQADRTLNRVTLAGLKAVLRELARQDPAMVQAAMAAFEPGFTERAKELGLARYLKDGVRGLDRKAAEQEAYVTEDLF
jgi:hypothetical protein